MDNRDNHHDEALKIKEFLIDSNESTVINTTVIVETLNRSVGTKDDVQEIYDDLYSNNIVVFLTDEDYIKSLEINGWYNNSINYSDCTIITTMIDKGISKIVSFDGGFKKIGNYEVISEL